MSVKLVRSVTTTSPLSEVFAFLADFRTTSTWDPGTVRTELLEGDGGVGTRYANVSRFAGRDVTLTYEVQDYQAERRIQLRAENATMTAVDTMSFAETPTGGTHVTYRAIFTFKGPVAWLMPLFSPAFRRLGDKAQHGMQTALDALGA